MKRSHTGAGRLIIAAFCVATGVCPGAAAIAGPTVTVDVTGYAIQSGKEDADSARRRALADAIYAAALAGGARVSGHAATDKGIITSDVAIMRPVGQVLGETILSQRQDGDQWQVTIRATVGPADTDNACPGHQVLNVSAYPARIKVDTTAPAWTEALAAQVASDLESRLSDLPQVRLLRVNTRPMPTTGSAATDALDYDAIMYGSARLRPGELAWQSDIHIGMVPSGKSKAIRLTATLRFVDAQGQGFAAGFTRDAKLPNAALLGRVAPLVTPDRLHLAARLTDGLPETLQALAARAGCTPVAARLVLSAAGLGVPVGSANGISHAALAFTTDGDASVQMLEITRLSENSTLLRPLDPTVSLKSLAGRPIQFLETAPIPNSF